VSTVVIDAGRHFTMAVHTFVDCPVRSSFDPGFGEFTLDSVCVVLETVHEDDSVVKNGRGSGSAEMVSIASYQTFFMPRAAN